MLRCSRVLAVVGVFVLLTATRSASAQGAQEESAIRKAFADYVAAVNRHDLRGVLAFLTNDVVDMEPDGSVIAGRAAFEKATTEVFKASGKGYHLGDAKFISIRFIRPDVALVVGEGEESVPNQ